MASVCRDGSGALAYFATVFEGDKARRKAILQAMVDVLWAGAVTYDITFKALEKADARSRTEGEARLEILSNMMQSVEGALSGVTGKTTLRVQKALSGQKPAQRGTDAQLAVLDWVEKDLKADGVVEPKLPAPVSTAPASSAPASRSAK